MTGLDAPNVPRRPLAVEARALFGRMGSGRGGRHAARSRKTRRKRSISTMSRCRFVLDAEEALEPDSPLVHPAHGSNVLARRNFVWGAVEKDFAAARSNFRLRVKWGRSRPRCRSRPSASWRAGIRGARCSTSGPRSRCRSYADQIGARAEACPATSVRVHYDVDVGGSYGVKRGIKHTVLVGYLARRLGCADAADRGPAGEHARRRRAWTGAACSTSRSHSTATASSAR